MAFAPSSQHVRHFVSRPFCSAGVHLACACEEKQKHLQIYFSRGASLNQRLTGRVAAGIQTPQLPFQVWPTPFPELPYGTEPKLSSVGACLVSYIGLIPFPVSHCHPLPIDLFQKHFLLNHFHTNPHLRRNPCLAKRPPSLSSGSFRWLVGHGVGMTHTTSTKVHLSFACRHA